MCLIIVAHRACHRWPLVVAANRDEEYARPSRRMHRWDDAPDVLGGRDLREGGSWLAVTRTRRFAAVTNLRGGEATRFPTSRGTLVRDFVLSNMAPDEYAAAVVRAGAEYAGFHLLAGVAGATLAHATNADGSASILPPGIHGVSNGPPAAEWAKVSEGKRVMAEVLARGDDAERTTRDLLAFLTTPSDAARRRGGTAREDLESESFVFGDRYGTRSSSVILVDAGGEVRFTEQNFRVGGVADGEVEMIVSS
ncbi:MAG TPA: NRDE family protein [Thermoanaerobaculia bacterium]|nr:NRDE family protein [Thermoanaerobaculia bacterium]